MPPPLDQPRVPRVPRVARHRPHRAARHPRPCTVLHPQLTALYRLLRESAAGGASGESLEAVLRGDGRYGRSGRVAGRLIRVLTQLQLATYDRTTRALQIELEASKTSLERSTSFTAYAERLAQARAYLGHEALPKVAAAA